jgi:hypothetical protein
MFRLSISSRQKLPSEPQASARQSTRRSVYVHPEHFLKEFRIARQAPESPLSKPRVTIQVEQNPPNPIRPLCQTTMISLVVLQVSGSHCVSNRHRLSEAQMQSLSSNGIHASGRITHKCDILMMDSSQTPGHRRCSSFHASCLCAVQTPCQLRELPPSIFQAHAWIARNQCQACFAIL